MNHSLKISGKTRPLSPEPPLPSSLLRCRDWCLETAIQNRQKRLPARRHNVPEFSPSKIESVDIIVTQSHPQSIHRRF